MGGESMKVASLNVGELRLERDGKEKFNKLCTFLAKNKFDICFLQETHVSGAHLRTWSETCAYEAYWSKEHRKDYNKPLLQQAGVAILVRKEWKAFCEESDLFTTAKQPSGTPPEIAFNAHIIAVKLTTVNILLVSIYVPVQDHFPGEIKDKMVKGVMKKDFSEKQASRFRLFYEPFLSCLEKWTGEGVIVAGDMNDITTRYEDVNSNWNIFNQLSKRSGFDNDLQGGYFTAYENSIQWKWNYAYNKNGELRKVRYDYIFSKNITRVRGNDKAFRVHVPRENKKPIQSQDPVLQLDNIQISESELVQSNGKGEYYLPHSLLSSEFELPKQIVKRQLDEDDLVRKMDKTSVNDNKKHRSQM